MELSLPIFTSNRQSGHSGDEVGKLVNLRRAGVSAAADRGKEKVKNDPAFLRHIDK